MTNKEMCASLPCAVVFVLGNLSNLKGSQNAMLSQPLSSLDMYRAGAVQLNTL